MPVEDQAHRLRQLMREVRRTRTIAVTSGKGGVGKSNVALNLAILLSAGGHRVALVDADLGLANLDVLLDVTIGCNLSHVVRGSRTLSDVVVHLSNGVQLVPGASGLADLTELSTFERQRLLQELTRLEADNDVILVDTGAGIGPSVLQFAASADDVLVVTTPEPPAVTDAYALIKVLHRRGCDRPMRLLVNQARDRKTAAATYSRIAAVAQRFLGIDVLDAGYLPEDANVRQAVAARTPFVLSQPNCPASKHLAAVVERLSRSRGRQEQQEGFFRRVANWFR